MRSTVAAEHESQAVRSADGRGGRTSGTDGENRNDFGLDGDVL